MAPDDISVTSCEIWCDIGMLCDVDVIWIDMNVMRYQRFACQGLIYVGVMCVKTWHSVT